MQVDYRVSNDMKVSFDATTHKEIFGTLAKIGEVFGNGKCQKCGNTDLKYVVRNVEDNDFYELRCNNMKCRAKLHFGVKKKGDELFPKRKNDDGYLADGGWVIYNPKTGQEE
jgi:hypothetical protein